MDSSLSSAGVDGEARRYFDITSFRPGQREALDAVLSGDDALVVLPTGAGKSLIYQIAALVMPGTVIVVSPLIALMHDQTESLRRRAVPGVAALHSQIPDGEQRDVLAALGEGRLNLLYVTPERCAQEEFLEIARRTRIDLFAVDEAHCISEWGNDFRPAYLLLDDAARALGRPPILSLTATATPWVREQIIERLTMNDPRVIVRGFDRPNLFYEVYRADDDRAKRHLLRSLLTRAALDDGTQNDMALRDAGDGSGIIYTGFTRQARELSQWLNRQGVHAAYYHGQMRAAGRTAVQEAFQAGEVRAIAATNAFGLGIDRGDLRFVVHYDVPASIEAYYQESGRAGRDGDFARCPLLFREEDLRKAAFAGGSGSLSLEEVARIAEVLRRSPAGGLTRTNIIEQSGLSRGHVIRGLELLTFAEALSERRGRYRPLNLDDARLQQAVEREERRRTHDRTRLEMVRAYAQAEGCRRQFLLQYFGQYDPPDTCSMCDRCVPRAGEGPVPNEGLPSRPAGGPFQPGDQVCHVVWGAGTVQHVTDERLTLHFADAGYRILDLAAVQEQHLLRPIDRL
jgi:ATP-dependent DNA helicase RecQ